MSERAKPFVAWMGGEDCRAIPAGGVRSFWLAGQEEHRAAPPTYTVPVVVTPLLPDDPRPGETWVSCGGQMPREITGAPFVHYDGKVYVPVRTATGGGFDEVARLRRPPVMKTFRVQSALDNDIGGGMCHINVRAESREEAVRKLAESLEEVTP